MDPFYFLELDYKLNDTHTEMLEYLSVYPNGNWSVCLDENEIVYQDKEYMKLEFDNETKILSCFQKDNETVDMYILRMARLSEH
jgi:hypothetical protein